jgi:hypothetical protein
MHNRAAGLGALEAMHIRIAQVRSLSLYLEEAKGHLYGLHTIPRLMNYSCPLPKAMKRHPAIRRVYVTSFV